MKRLLVTVGILGLLATAVESGEREPLMTDWLVSFIKASEGLRLEWYQDTSKHKAIGYGHRVHPVKGPKRVTVAQAERFLVIDLLRANKALDRLVDVEVDVYQREALLSFVFNVGEGRFARSDVRRYLNKGRYLEAGVAMGRYVKSEGRVLGGLKKRREAEMQRFFTLNQKEASHG